MRQFSDISEHRFGQLVAKFLSHRDGRGRAYWFCRCDCGVGKVIAGYHLKSGDVISCGCYQKSRQRWSGAQHKTHGQGHGTKTYKLWISMRSRCRNPRSKAYKDYGGRGITVCDRWYDSFEAFFEDMGECSPGLSIERLDVNGPYCKDNCVYATNTQQQRNRRNTVKYLYEGHLVTVPEIVERTGMDMNALRCRLRDGWSLERALIIPVRVYRARKRSSSQRLSRALDGAEK